MCVSHGGELVKGQSSFAKGMPRFIDRSFFYDVADQYKALSQDGSKFLMPQYRGECFLHPGFIEICEHLERIDMPFGFTTNAALLTQEKTEALLAMSKFTAIVFSIDGATKETFEKIRLRGNYDQVMENVQRFLELARPRIQAGSLMASVNFTLQPDNAHEKEQMIEQWADRSFQVTFSNLAVNGRPTKLNFSPERVACPDLTSFLVVLTDGSIVPCCRDYEYKLKMGSLHDSTLEEIWHGPTYQKFRELHNARKWNDIDVCNDCDTWSLRYGVTTELLQGDMQVTKSSFTETYRRLPSALKAAE